MRRTRAIVAAALALAAGGVAVAAVDGVTLPPEWTADEVDVEGVELHYSPDLRCRVAAVSAAAKGVSADQLWSAVRASATELGVEIGDGSEPVSFERGEFTGAIRLRRVAGDEATWQLQACFYRKRNQHVCKPICQNLLG